MYKVKLIDGESLLIECDNFSITSEVIEFYITSDELQFSSPVYIVPICQIKYVKVIE